MNETELLIAYIDGKLSADEQAALELRLAAEPRLCEALAQVVLTETALAEGWVRDGQRRDPLSVAGRPHHRWGAVPGLAGAAAAVVVLTVAVSLAGAIEFRSERDAAEQRARDADDARRRATADAATARAGYDTANKQLSQARLEVQRSRAAESILQESAQIAQVGPLQSLAYVGTILPAAVQPGEVEVTVRNDYLPCRIVLKSDADSKVRDVVAPRGDSKVTIPAGKVRVSCEPMFGGAWFQPFGVVDRRGYLGTSLGPVLLTVNAGEPLHVRMDQPFPPWNATMLRVKGEWVIVTLERPWAELQVKEFRAGTFGGTEELPNTALFWARDKSGGMAEELARFFVANRDKNRDGKFRGLRHTSLIVPATASGVTAGIKTLTADELVGPLTEAFEYLRRQRPPAGPTIEQEIARAAELLLTLPKK